MFDALSKHGNVGLCLYAGCLTHDGQTPTGGAASRNYGIEEIAATTADAAERFVCGTILLIPYLMKRSCAFCIGVFNMPPLTSTPCELSFAAVRQWLAKTFRALSMSTLNAKLFLDRVDKDYQAMMRRCDSDGTRGWYPLWEVSAPRHNGYHSFQSGTKRKVGDQENEAVQAWRALPEDDRRQRGVDARVRNRSDRILQEAA